MLLAGTPVARSSVMNEHTTLPYPPPVHSSTPAAALPDGGGEAPPPPSMAGPVALDAAAAAAAGAIAGTVGGPVGMAIGAVIGGLVGAVAGVAVESADREKSLHDEQLDRVIGVSGGNIGEASPDQPPSHGRFQAAALGVSSGEAESSDGPIQNVDGGRG
jgi:hypothetical protein